jgi:hypothetical protein
MVSRQAEIMAEPLDLMHPLMQVRNDADGLVQDRLFQRGDDH